MRSGCTQNLANSQVCRWHWRLSVLKAARYCSSESLPTGRPLSHCVYPSIFVGRNYFIIFFVSPTYISSISLLSLSYLTYSSLHTLQSHYLINSKHFTLRLLPLGPSYSFPSFIYSPQGFIISCSILLTSFGSHCQRKLVLSISYHHPSYFNNYISRQPSNTNVQSDL